MLDHIYYLEQAIASARYGEEFFQEVPVGAVLVGVDGEIVASAHNEKETRQESTAHAEILCIQRACQKIKSWRLNEMSLYVTLEPCPMCLGAILQARISHLVFGAKDSKWGACGSVIDFASKKKFNHSLACTYIETPEAQALLPLFFKQRR